MLFRFYIFNRWMKVCETAFFVLFRGNSRIPYRSQEILFLLSALSVPFVNDGTRARVYVYTQDRQKITDMLTALDYKERYA